MLDQKFKRALIYISFSSMLIYTFIYLSPQAVFKHSSYTYNVFVRQKKDLSADEIKREIQRNFPAIPFDYLERNANRILRKNASCAYYPNLFDLDFSNVHWQKFKNKNFTYNLYGAYYDKREILDTPAVRLIAMSNLRQYEVIPKTYCQIWFDYIEEPLIVPVQEHNCIWPFGHTYRALFYPYLLNCYIPASHAKNIPKTVSLVDNECGIAKNNLKINFNDLAPNQKKQDFAVCHKGLDLPFVDMSLRLTEWFEAVRALGAKKVGIYQFQNHPNIVETLKYYKDTGFIDVSPLNMVNGHPNAAGYAHLLMKYHRLTQFMNELVPYNDCFYKNMYKYEYIVLIDMDELIMPLGELTSWHDLIEAAKQQNPAECAKTGRVSYCLANVYFPHYENSSDIIVEVPEHLYMLQHVRRIIEPLPVGFATKCLHSTDYVVALHNHYPSIYKVACAPQQINVSMGLLYHYREPDNGQNIFNASKVDLRLWHFKDQIIERTQAVLDILDAKRLK